MEKQRETVKSCMNYLAQNAANNEWNIRIGLYLLDFEDVGMDVVSEDRPNKYRVYNMKTGERYEYGDLFKAVVRFVELVNAD